MQNFYLTFGQNHPLKDGYVRIKAESEKLARQKAIENYAQKWSGLYTDANWDPSYFPNGEVQVLE